MAWTTYQLRLAVLMVIAGSFNTLSSKWADGLASNSRDGVLRKFHHPIFQTLCMFFAQCLCFIIFKIIYKILSNRGDGSEDKHIFTKGSRDFNPLRLLIPAVCDMASTSLMFIGLNLTYASSYQMLRGAVIIFVGILSRIFLGRVLKTSKWAGIFFIMVGLTIVGTSDFINKDSIEGDYGASGLIIGDVLIIVAQMISATQMVTEEKYVSGLNIPPLEAVGWEGIFGFSVLSLLLIPCYFIKVGPPFSNNPTGALEDVYDALIQIGNNYQLVIAVLGMIISLGFFNFAGVSVTKEFSATTRMVLDSVRTIVVWFISLLFMGQAFQWLQLVGFIVQILGMALYNNITCNLWHKKCEKKNIEEKLAKEYVQVSTTADNPS